MKRVSILLVGLLFLFFALPASSQDSLDETNKNLVINQLQTGGSGSGTATEELVVIFNPTESDIKIDNWCVEYKSSSFNTGFNSCVEQVFGFEFKLSASGLMTFATDSFVLANPGFVPDFKLKGGMSGSSGHLLLVDDLGNEIDKVGWGSASNPEVEPVSSHSSGKTLARLNLGVDTNNNFEDFHETDLLSEYVSGVFEVEIDYCSNIDGVQKEVPIGYVSDELRFCTELESSEIIINELLPNPESYDTGLEFIELFNPNSRTVELAGYKILVGPDYSKYFEFETGEIGPKSYIVYSDFETGIKLPNTNGIRLRMISPSGDEVSETQVYASADEEESWAMVDGVWAYTNRPTPGEENKPYLVAVENEKVASSYEYAPCPAGKFRNPDTNRCKSITTTSSLVPCGPGQYRSTETNRCRKIETESKEACDEGQYRNPETGRCKKITVLGVQDIEELPVVTDVEVAHKDGKLNVRVMAIVFLATVAYIVYEWRREIKSKWVAIYDYTKYNINK